MKAPETRNEFINQEVSEKITLVHLSASSRLYDFTNTFTDIYAKQVKYVITSVSNYTLGMSDRVDPGEWFFDILTMTLHIGESGSISEAKIIVTYRLFFSDTPVITTWDLEDISTEVEYDARIEKAPEFKSSVGTNQKGTSLTNSGTLELQNNDGFFDDIYDFLVFESKEVIVYSWNRNLKPSESIIIYKGNIYDKSFSSSKVTFQIKNIYTRIQESLVLDQYSATDNVSDVYFGNYKRLVYGRVNELLVRSIDQVGTGYDLTGTIDVNVSDDAIVTGKTTLFTTELSVNDLVEIDGQEFKVETITDNTHMTISSNDPIYTRAEDIEYEEVTITTLTGVITGSVLTPRTITGTGTLFLSELSNGDVIQIGSNNYNVDNVLDDLTIEIDSDILVEFSGVPFNLYATTTLSGNVSFTPPARTVYGTGTLFLDETTQGDTITFNGSSFIIEDVIDDTTLIVDGDNPITGDIIAGTATNVPEISWNKRNREFLVSGHAMSQSNADIVSVKELNRMTVDDASLFVAGDIISILSDSEVFQQNAEILRVIDNQITFVLNLSQKYPSNYIVRKQPITKVFIDTVEIGINDIIAVDNTSAACRFTIDQNTEFNIAKPKNINVSFQFIADSRTVTLASLGFDNLTEILEPRDFIKSINDPDNRFSEVLKVESNKIILRTPYEGGSHISTLTYRSPNTIGDDSIVTANVLGKTVDGTPSGALLTSGPDIIRDLLEDSELTSLLDLPSFDEAKIDSTYSVGIAIPETITASTLPTIKDVIDKISKTISGALTINSALQLSYNIMDVKRPENKDLRIINTDDLKLWKVKSKSGNLYRSVDVNYSQKDYSNTTKEEGFETINLTSEYVEDFDTSNKTDEIDLYTDNLVDATELGQRYLYYNTLSQADITLISDLRLSDLEIGQSVVLNIPRLYARLGDPSTRLKICVVTGLTVDGKTTTVVVNDLGNLWNRSGVITSDDEIEFDTATAEQKIYASYITAENGAINDDETTQNVNLIF